MIAGMAMIAPYVLATLAITPVQFFFSLLFGGLLLAIEAALNLKLTGLNTGSAAGL